MQETAGVRRAGAAALDFTDVASGRLDGFWELRLAPWDVAAGLLIVREAGGRVTTLDGRDATPDHGAFVVSNGLLHPWLLERVNAREA
jgi:myo-inositol-1(or 4)-monophosphatase